MGDPDPRAGDAPAARDGALPASFTVEVAWATPNEQAILSVEVDEGTTIEQAVERSGILERFPEIDWPAADVGVFGKLARKDQLLAARDRVEIYRPLIADPKAVRRERAARRAGSPSDAS